MRDLVEYLVKSLVDHPEAVAVNEERDGGGAIFEVHVDPADLGKVIGKGGKIANSIRTLVKATASSEYGRASVEIITD